MAATMRTTGSVPTRVPMCCGCHHLAQPCGHMPVSGGSCDDEGAWISPLPAV